MGIDKVAENSAYQGFIGLRHGDGMAVGIGNYASLVIPPAARAMVCAMQLDPPLGAGQAPHTPT
ncbi:hypothetical protein GCM10011408_39500 [Dyella caseinilytica]|nr:hypothetical protein GCM10011408_39500 [Dyella caseinilytica]